MEIILEFDTWRKIKDFEGDEGWVHQSLLSGRRTALIQGEEPVSVRRKPGAGERLVAYMEPNVVASVQVCEKDWCRLDAAGYKGWVSRASLWGVYEGEVLE
ncbi:MAG: hypothetical protein DHS20C02_04230 [Micavibrio sp.]|nr:MAG: hypothetical protein DHS20C02_04230 [Micavibrio sp.]